MTNRIVTRRPQSTGSDGLSHQIGQPRFFPFDRTTTRVDRSHFVLIYVEPGDVEPGPREGSGQRHAVSTDAVVEEVHVEPVGTEAVAQDHGLGVPQELGRVVVQRDVVPDVTQLDGQRLDDALVVETEGGRESLGHDDARRIGDLIEDDAETIETTVVRGSIHAQMTDLLRLLNPIEKDIIRRRFGLGTPGDQTLDEIGKLYNLSRERVRQIQAQGLMKMRRMCERRDIGLTA